MPAPANDNFANAIVLGTDKGTAQFNNIGATIEPGEPVPNQGHTVWFQWTPSASFQSEGYAFFSTVASVASIPTPWLRSEIRVYQLAPGSLPAFANLTEVTYLWGKNSQYGGVSLGGLVTFNASALPTFYIRVDSAPNSTPGKDDQGNFQLTWGPTGAKPMLGGCNTCTSDIALKTTCLATFQMPFPLFENGDIVNTFAFAVSRQRITAPSGTYMLRYCGGYYLFNQLLFTNLAGLYAFTNAPTLLFGAGGSLSVLFHSGAADGLKLHMSNTAPPNPPTMAGALSVGFTNTSSSSVNSATVGVAWWDGSQWQPTDGSGYPNFNNVGFGAFDNFTGTASGKNTGNPVAPLISGITNPCCQVGSGANVTDSNFPSWFPNGVTIGYGQPVTAAGANSQFQLTPPFLQDEYACESSIFHHAGGAMNWFSVVGLCTAAYLDGGSCQSITLPDGIGVDLSPLFVIQQNGPCGNPNLNFPTAQVSVGRAAPTYKLERILPDISLVSALNIYGQDLTANGQKNADFDLIINNNSIIGWNNVTITPNGFFTAQDPNSYFIVPGGAAGVPPQIANIPPGQSDIHASWVMTNPVGTVTVTLSDADGNPFPSFNINITPLFKLNSIALGNEFTSNGQKCRAINTALQNIGNGTTIAVKFVVTATVNGQPINLGLNIGQIGPLSPSVTWSPFFGNTDAVNPSGLGLGWQPSLNVPGIDFYVAATPAPQNVVLTISPSDTGNNFPPIQASILVPAA